MSTLSQGDRLRQKLNDIRCCNPPVFKVGPRDASETTLIRKLKTIGFSTAPNAKIDETTTTNRAASCPVAVTFECSNTQPLPETTFPLGAK